MKKIGTFTLTLCVAALFGTSASFAQTPAPAAPATPAAPAATAKPPATPDAPAKAAKAAKPNMTPQTAKSKECSLKADAQKLHGKERQKFRAECKKAA